MLAAPSKFQTFAEFFHFFVPSLTGVVGFLGHRGIEYSRLHALRAQPAFADARPSVSLPTTMTFYSFIGVAVTSATAIIFGQAIWDPVQVLARLGIPSPS